MQHLEHLAALDTEIDTFVATIRDASLDRPVPTCPGWDLAELIRHTGCVHRWAEWHVRNVAPQRRSQADIGIAAPSDDELVEWFTEGGRLVVATLRAADPDAAMWAWGADQHVRFWSRRQAHETAIHRVDAEAATGTISALAPQLAADGISELLDNIPTAAYFAPNVRQLVGEGESLHIHCTDTEGEWTITLEPDGFRVDATHSKATVAVRGRASDLALALYKRTDLDDRFEVFGDRAVLDFWLAHAWI